MGGYGLVNVIGGGLQRRERHRAATRRRIGCSPTAPRRIRGTATPWTRGSARRLRWRPGACSTGIWDGDGLAGIQTPVLFVAGSADVVAGYEKGTKAIFDGAVNADRYLLTF